METLGEIEVIRKCTGRKGETKKRDHVPEEG